MIGVLYYQHDVSWVDQQQLQDSEYFGMISIFNNFIDNRYSEGVIIDPTLIGNNNYAQGEDNLYLPVEFYETISHTDTMKQFSSSASNFQLLPNGNFLLHAARQGRTVELSKDENPVWEYMIPLRNGFAVSQGEELNLSDNFTFSLRRYASEYPAFIGRDLTSQGYLELEPNESYCNLTSIDENIVFDNIKIFPNPVGNTLYISFNDNRLLSIFDLLGRVVLHQNTSASYIDVSALKPGIYFLAGTQSNPIKFVKK